MTFVAACVCSLVRSIVVAVVGLLVAARLQGQLIAASGWRRTLMWSLVLLPAFVPGLLVGYGYRNFSLSLVHYPAWNEALYAALELFLVVPVGTLILVCAPPPAVSPSAVHVARLMRSPTPALRLSGAAGVLSLWVRSHLFAVLPAGAAMFLLSFQETEVATLMQARGWPEWIFTRLAIDLSLTGALGRLLLPMFVQVLVIASALRIIRDGLRDRLTPAQRPPIEQLQFTFNWGYVLASLAGVLLIPGGLVVRGTLAGFAVLGAHPALLSQIGIAMLFGVTAGLLAWLASGWIVERLDRRWGIAASVILLVPGLLGAWTLGLFLASLFQNRLLQPLANTPLPMIVGEVLFQLPRAVLVRLLLGRLRESTAAHSANLLLIAPDANRRRRAAELLWQLDLRGRIVGGMIVCYWAYMELTIPSPALLGPPGMTTAPVLLYNQMHYGQIPGLSALVFTTMAVPVVSLIVLSQAARRLTGWLRPS